MSNVKSVAEKEPDAHRLLWSIITFSSIFPNFVLIFYTILCKIQWKITSHRLEKNADNKNIDYKEPKTSRSYSTSESDADRERKKQTNAEGQTQDTEAIWDLTRESGTDNASIGNRGSFADEENASVDNIVEGIEKGSNKRRISDIEG